MPQELRPGPTGICPGTRFLHHLHLWLAKHCLQNIRLNQRPSNHARWWRLTNSGKGAKQRHGNCREIPPDLEVKAQYYKSSVGCLPSFFHVNNKEAKRELKIKHKKNLLFWSKHIYLGVMLDRTLTYSPPRATSQKIDITHCISHVSCWLWLWCWCNNIENSHLSPGPFNCRVLRSCLVSQCSHLPHWLTHQWRLANCDWILAS